MWRLTILTYCYTNKHKSNICYLTLYFLHEKKHLKRSPITIGFLGVSLHKSSVKNGKIRKNFKHKNAILKVQKKQVFSLHKEHSPTFPPDILITDLVLLIYLDYDGPSFASRNEHILVSVTINTNYNQ